MCTDCCTMTVHLQTWVKALCPLLTPTSPPLLKEKQPQNPNSWPTTKKLIFGIATLGFCDSRGNTPAMVLRKCIFTSGGALQWIISLQCIAMALSDKVVSSVQKRVKAQRGLASNCPPCVRSFKEQRWHWGEIVKIQKSSISPLHLFSICKSAVVTNLSNLIQGNCPDWPLPPPTSLSAWIPAI